MKKRPKTKIENLYTVYSDSNDLIAHNLYTIMSDNTQNTTQDTTQDQPMVDQAVENTPVEDKTTTDTSNVVVMDTGLSLDEKEEAPKFYFKSAANLANAYSITESFASKIPTFKALIFDLHDQRTTTHTNPENATVINPVYQENQEWYRNYQAVEKNPTPVSTVVDPEAKEEKKQEEKNKSPEDYNVIDLTPNPPENKNLIYTMPVVYCTPSHLQLVQDYGNAWADQETKMDYVEEKCIENKKLTELLNPIDCKVTTDYLKREAFLKWEDVEPVYNWAKQNLETDPTIKGIVAYYEKRMDEFKAPVELRKLKYVDFDTFFTLDAVPELTMPIVEDLEAEVTKEMAEKALLQYRQRYNTWLLVTDLHHTVSMYLGVECLTKKLYVLMGYIQLKSSPVEMSAATGYPWFRNLYEELMCVNKEIHKEHIQIMEEAKRRAEEVLKLAK